MRRCSKHGIYSNSSIRYVGNNKYSDRNIFAMKCRYNDNEYEVKTKHVQFCLRCGGSKFSCKGIPHELNQYGSKYYKCRRNKKHKKHEIVKQFLNEGTKL